MRLLARLSRRDGQELVRRCRAGRHLQGGV